MQDMNDDNDEDSENDRGWKEKERRSNVMEILTTAWFPQIYVAVVAHFI